MRYTAAMSSPVAFLLGAPRSGTTLFARILGAHSTVHAPPEPHLITPLAHLGFYATVEKAAYDPLITARAARDLVAQLPGGEQDYLDAIRACSDHVYERLLAAAPGKRLLLDKTPASTLVAPFLVRLYPEAPILLLLRHPLAVLTSYVESFFAGDYEVALAHNPILQRYVPAMAALVRRPPARLLEVRYESLVKDPAAEVARACAHLGVPFEVEAIEYGRSGEEGARGLGDPVSVARHDRPVTSSVKRWAAEIATNPAVLARVGAVLDELDPADLETLGYPRTAIVADLEAARGAPVPERREVPWRYAMERRLLVALRRNIQQNALGRQLRRLRFALDVLLRE